MKTVNLLQGTGQNILFHKHGQICAVATCQCRLRPMCGAVWCTVFVHVRFESPLYVTHRISEWYIVLQERSSNTVRLHRETITIHEKQYIYNVKLYKYENNTNYIEKQLQSMETIQCQTLQIHRLRYLPWTSVALPAMDMEPPAKRLLLFPVAEIYFFHCGDFLVAKLGFFCCWLFSCLGRFSRRKHEKNELKNNQPRCRKNAWGEKNAFWGRKSSETKKTKFAVGKICSLQFRS